MNWNDVDWLGVLGKVGLVILILLVTWLIARLVRAGVAKLVTKVDALSRPGADGRAVGDSLGTIASLLVWLFGLIAVLQVFALNEVLAPIQSMLDTFLQYLPNLVGAGFIFFIGYVIAKILRQLVETALSTVKFDGLLTKVRQGTDSVTGQAPAHPAAAAPSAAATEQMPVQPQGQPVQPQPAQQAAPAPAAQPTATAPAGPRIPQIVGNLVFAVVIIVVSIAALQVLGISAISQPAEQMLTMVLNAIPMILAAAIVLAIGYVIAKFVGDLLESTLKGLGTDRAVASLGIVPEGQSASVILTRVAQVAIMVFFAIMAARLLDFPEISAILDEVLSIGGRVLFGALIIAAGFIVAKLIAGAMGEGTASTVIKYATIVLFAAMGLRYMGLADSIINLAFGAVVVGGALAAALAYGIGGRDAAARSLEKLHAKAEKGSTPTA